MKVYLLEESLNSDCYIFSETPDLSRGTWALCSDLVAKAARAGYLREQLVIVEVKGVAVFPIMAMFVSEIERVP